MSGVSPDTIFATVTSLGVVILSAIAKLIYDKREEIAQLKDIRTFLCEHLRIILNLVDHRIKGYQSLGQLTAESQSNFNYPAEPVPSAYLSSLPQVDLFKAVRRGPRKTRPKRLTTYSKLIAALHVVTTESHATQQQFHYFVENQSRYSQEFSDAARALRRLYREYLVTARLRNIPPSQDPLMADLNLVVTEVSRAGERTSISELYSNFIEPVRQICVTYQDDPRRVELLVPVNDASSAKTHRDDLMTTFAKYFVDAAETLSQSRAVIAEALELYSQ